ncbi:hypothetical protein OG453_28795 [Streptomyces sp. NBC_01381]|uniref:hypothetical protein n=1 Tax=Streptomyces sp. NBC_01381 TaxID=2903845 RepID=UPI00225421B3|nr:hypothetical protein [Streptomyces sp. NBC_01381]MCX4670644.1 hypothetical protein [Streptomyces sp. NBC_01381]
MNPTTLLKDTFTGPGSLARVVGAGMLVATIAAQHPHPAFDRVRAKDLFSFVPNWKFFAPNPATHDFHYVYRTLDHTGGTSEWSEIDMIEPRKMYQAFWFATRRPEKSVFDLCTAILQQATQAGATEVQKTSSYRVLAEFIRKTIRDQQGDTNVKGFQFAVVRAAGHDTSEDPEPLFISPYTPMHRVGPHLAAA